MKKNINVYYFKSEKNFGDLLNIHILEKIFGFKVRYTEIKRTKILGLGSLMEIFLKELNKLKWKYIIKFFFNPVIIFSTGFIKEEKDFNISNKIKLTRIKWTGVRGKLTYNRIKKYFPYANLSNTALGDAGLLCNNLIDLSNIKKKYKVGVILHYIDTNNVYKQNIKIKGAKFIDIQNDPMKILNEIAQCEFILSSAMHGLISADALYVPNKWIKLSDNITGGNYKFKDYYSVFDLDEIEPVDLRKQNILFADIEKFKNEYIKSDRATQVENIQKNLIESYKKVFH